MCCLRRRRLNNTKVSFFAFNEKILENIFDSINGPITELASDSGSEFLGNRQFFKDRHIYYRCKYGKGNAYLVNNFLGKFDE